MQIENHDKQNIIILQENRNLFHNIEKFWIEVIIVLKFAFSSIYRILIYEPYKNLEQNRTFRCSTYLVLK